MIGSWKAKLNNRSKFVVIIMDLSEAFDSLNRDCYWQNWKYMVWIITQ